MSEERAPQANPGFSLRRVLWLLRARWASGPRGGSPVAALLAQGFADVALQVEPGTDPVRLAAVQTESQRAPRGT